MSWNEGNLSPDASPLWRQIADRLRRSIATGEFRPGDVLPSETEINATFQVSRATARASLERLRQEGLIRRQSGRGSTVLAPKVEQPVNELSGGNQQKVAIARVLHQQADVLLLDEPTRGIDVGAQADLERLLAELRAQGLALIFISSEIAELARNSQRVVVLRDRAKVAELAGAEVDEAAIMRAIADDGGPAEGKRQKAET